MKRGAIGPVEMLAMIDADERAGRPVISTVLRTFRTPA